MPLPPVFPPRVPGLLAMVFAVALTGQPAVSQPLELVVDLVPGPPGGEGSSPRGFETHGRFVTFEVDGGLWATDGTANSVHPLLKPEALSLTFQAPQIVAEDGDTLYWLQPLASLGPQLWRADLRSHRSAMQLAKDLSFDFPSSGLDMIFAGDSLYFEGLSVEDLSAVARGIYRVARDRGVPDLLIQGPDSFSGFQAQFEELHGRVLVLTTDAAGERGLWQMDGSAEGTVRLANFGAGGRAAPQAPTRAGDQVYFFADTGTGTELWASDGTAVGTRQVTRFRREGTFPLSNIWLHGEGDRVYFLASTPALGTELWVSDGTAAGTRPVTDLALSNPFAFIEESFQWLDGQILFLARESAGDPFRLWRTTGDPATTALVMDGGAPPATEATMNFLAAGQRVYFLDDVSGPSRTRLWTSDGTADGTVPVDTLCGGDCAGNVLAVAALPASTLQTAVPQEIVFIDRRPGGPRQLFRTDGTAAGTRLLMTPAQGLRGEPLAEDARWIASLGSSYVLGATDPTYGFEPWALRPPTGGGNLRATMLADLAGDGPGSDPRGFQRFQGGLAFLATDPTPGVDRDRIVVQGPAGSVPRPLLEAPPWSGPDRGPLEFLSRGDLLFVRSTPDNVIWRSDGTDGGSFRAWPASGNGGGGSAPPALLGFAGDSLLFLRRSPCELWSADGTGGGGAEKIADLGPDICDVGPATAIGEELYFILEAPAGERHGLVVRSDGTAAGTKILADLEGAFVRLTANPRFTAFDDGILFLWAGGLWRSEGDSAATSLLVELDCCATTSPMVELDGALYFLITSPTTSTVLWRTDGTAEGTTRIRNFPAYLGPLEFDPPLVAFDGRLLFTADTTSRGRELWTSDGTAAGTRLFHEIYPDASGSFPRSMTMAGERLWFTAEDPFHGRELWVLEDSIGPPQRVQDLNPGTADGIPKTSTSLITTAGDEELFLAATDGLRGLELWRLPLGDLPPGCQPGPERLCLQQGRFAITSRWRDFQGRTGAGQAAPLTADTGTFWFFDQDNVETVVKVLDGRSNNGHFWTFYGSLTNVEVFMTVTDTELGAARRYFNPLRTFASAGDTTSFGPLGAGITAAAERPLQASQAHQAEPIVVESWNASAVGETCAPDSTRLCLQEGRFAVEARWTDFRGRSGVGQAVDLTADTGYFWFFRDANVEAVIKVLDGRANNGNFWVFYGALSNVDYDLIVTDTQTGAVKTYRNRNRTFASVGDTAAFPGTAP